ncbi:EAL domain-containing protein [Thioalkalicoccus limnaeus]|uniref:EAL domain-containing protein n=1 Tax=Thioalkalicoccus limnaeus TaxID=120681 RepID=A0ABV4BHQ0_9GAMM
MERSKQILCIDPEPDELRIVALLNRQGIAATLTEIAREEALDDAFANPGWWDLILCDAGSFASLGVEARVGSHKADLDASVVLVRSPDARFSPDVGFRRGAADVVQRGDMAHLLMVCERELNACAARKALRSSQTGAGSNGQGPKPALIIPVINDFGKMPRNSLAERPLSEGGLPAGGDCEPGETEARIRALIEADGLVLEFQPIVSVQANEGYRGMFEALVRLKDERGQLLFPDEFLPILARAGWLGRVDLWIFRRVLATLEEIQRAGHPNAVIFVNLATSTLNDDDLVKALGTFASAARLSPGSLVVEVHKAAFDTAPDGVRQLSERLGTRHHGLLVEDLRLDDGPFLDRFHELITHVKLDRQVTDDLVAGRVTQRDLADLVQRARREGIQVIALAVENVELLPRLFNAGVDAIQGHFVSLPSPELVYPGVQRVEASSLFGGPFAGGTSL